MKCPECQNPLKFEIESRKGGTGKARCSNCGYQEDSPREDTKAGTRVIGRNPSGVNIISQRGPKNVGGFGD